MRILVTGGAGFIGSWTVRELLQLGHEVVVLDDFSTGHRGNLDGVNAAVVEASILDVPAVRAAVAGCQGVVHLAAGISVPASCEDPIGYDLINVHGTVNVMEAARRVRCSRLVFASSAAVYGSDPSVPKVETMRLAPESPYGAQKAADEFYGRAYSTTLGLACVGLRYFNVFGPRQDPGGAYAAVIPAFVGRTVEGQDLTVHGDGLQTRDFVSVRDVARANAAALMASGTGVFNVGGGRATTILDLAEGVLRVVGGASRITHGPERAGDVRHSLADITAAREVLGWSPQAAFDEALAETVAWFRSC